MKKYQCPKCCKSHLASDWNHETSNHYPDEEIIPIEKEFEFDTYVCPSCQTYVNKNEIKLYSDDLIMNFESFRQILISWLNSKEADESYEFNLLVLLLANGLYGIPKTDPYFLVTTLINCANERQTKEFPDSFEYKNNNVYVNNEYLGWRELGKELEYISEEFFLKHSNWNEA